MGRDSKQYNQDSEQQYQGCANSSLIKPEPSLPKDDKPTLDTRVRGSH